MNLDNFVVERLFNKLGCLIVATLVIPAAYVEEVLVVTLSLTFLGLVLLAEVTTAGLLTMEGVACHEFADLDHLINIHGNRSVDSIHKELGNIMWDYVGMGRTKESLETALEKIKELRKEFETNLFVPGTQEGMNIELDKAFRLRDFITMGELIAYDALNREESCGGHFREEHQTEEGEAKRADENFFYVSCWKYNGDDEKAPTLLKEPLHYEAIKVQTRNYKN